MEIQRSVEIPRIISVDDHVVEPPDLWTARLGRLADRGPVLTREKGGFLGGTFKPNESGWVHDPDLPGAVWADVWRYEDMVVPLMRGLTSCGYESDDPSNPVTYDNILLGAFDRRARIADMDINHVELSLCFPTVSRFCGQMFLERRDKDVALAALRVYNDWMIDEWCKPDPDRRLIPLTLVPLWDPEMAAAEVRRCAEKGSHSIAFSECPPYLGLPSIYTDHWDPLWRACEETDSTVNMHIGSSSRLVVTADDSPLDVVLCLSYVNALIALTDWLYSGTLELYPSLKIALSESQVGWIPFAAQRADDAWRKGNEKFHPTPGGPRRATRAPSEAIADRVFGCIFEDVEGLRNRHSVGMSQILFETDYPHADSSWPNSAKVAADHCIAAGLNDAEAYALLRGNAIRAFGLDRYFGIKSLEFPEAHRGGQASSPSSRAIRIRCTSEVPSPTSRIFASR